MDKDYSTEITIAKPTHKIILNLTDLGIKQGITSTELIHDFLGLLRAAKFNISDECINMF